MSGKAASMLVPDRMFFGSSGNWMVSEVTRDGTGSARALAPGENYLGRFIVPPFQRAPAWTGTQKVRLIESIYMGLPIGSIIWNQTSPDNECDGWILDGQQRTIAICEYMRGGFPLLGWRFPDLPDDQKSRFTRMTVPVIEASIRSRAMCEDIYQRLAYGGTPHEPLPA